MARASCPACGAPIDLVRDVNTDEIVPLETNTDASNEAPRYRYVNTGPDMLVERVSDAAAGDFFADHRFDCKDFGAGRTF